MNTRRDRFPTLVLSLALAGCSGSPPAATTTATPGHDPTSPPTTQPAASTGTVAPPTSGPPSVTPSPVVAGSVIRQSPDAFVGDSRAVGDGPVFAGQDVHTEGSGLLAFRLDQKISECNLRPSTRVSIRPSEAIVLGFQSGVTTCITTSDPGVMTFDARPAELVLSDPLFVVSFSGDVVTVWVDSGVVLVRRAGTGESVLLGDRQRVEVDATGQELRPASWALGELPEESREDIDRLAQTVPPPDFSMPDPGSSEILTRIRDAGQIRIAMDARLEGDIFSQKFIANFATTQAERWGVFAGEPALMVTDEAVVALHEGTIDAFASAQPIDGLDDVPLLRPLDIESRKFVEPIFLWFVKDEGFAAAEGAFIRALIDAGDYRQLYQGAFGSEPRYDIFVPLYGLG
jgi:hypothetical protein